MNLNGINDALVNDLRPLRFSPPIAHVYNPLEYARESYDQYFRLYGTPPKDVVILGMNPGPWGMAQTGVPFGEVNLVKDWLGIEAPVRTPANMHPKRPVQGFACPRSEVSGKRLWGWARKTFGTPEKFFARFFVANYCPLLFIESSGRNRTPDNLRASEREPLLAVCDRATRRLIEQLEPSYIVGVGNFAERRARAALADLNVTIGKILHPSPANPKANRDWDSTVMRELEALGIQI